jgi:acyl carrier protein
MIEQQLAGLLKNISKEKEISSDTSLFMSGALDSMSMLTFLNLIEENYKISILNDNFDIRNFDTIKMIGNFIKKPAGTDEYE